jgi:hypothetical protein
MDSMKMNRRLGLAVSIPEFTGKVRALFALGDDAEGGDAAALVDLVNTWIRAVELGFFGPAGIRLQGPIEARGTLVSGNMECASTPPAAFRTLSKMVERFAEAKGRVVIASMMGENGERLGNDGLPAIPQLAASIPFVVERPEDLRREVRVEIEFRDAFGTAEQSVLVEAFSIWDAIVAALGNPQREPRGSEYDTRRLSPAIIEHTVFGYTAGFECFDLLVLFGLRLHPRHIIERITFE